MKYVYLENTTPLHNKFYEMIENPGGATFTAKYGRIGNRPQQLRYPMTEWDRKYDEKLQKGYIDKTYMKNKPKPNPKPKFIVNKEHLERVDTVMLVLTKHSSEIMNSTELIRDVGAVRAMLKDPNSKNEGELSADDMIYLNDVWKKIKHYTKKI